MPGWLRPAGPRNGYRLLRFIWTHPEVRGRRVRALVRAVAWQLWQRIFRRPWPVRLSPSIELLCHPHNTAAASVLYCRFPDWREMHLLVDVLRPGDHFVDVGANVGVYSLFASTIPGVEVWAFEPSTLASERAAENIDRNGLGARCHLFRAAVGRSAGTGHVTVGLGTMNRTTESAFEGRDAGVPLEAVRIVSLDDVIPVSVHPAVAVIKIDVEGQEISVLEGAATLLTNANAVIIVENNEPDALSGFFATRGFTQCTYDPRTRQIVAQGQSPGQMNSIYVKHIDAVRRRLAASSDRT